MQRKAALAKYSALNFNDMWEAGIVVESSHNEIDQAKVLADELINSIAAFNEAEMSKRFLELDNQITVMGSFPDPVFNSLVDPIVRSNVQSAPGVVYLLKIFEYNLCVLTQSQKQQLLRVLESSYEGFQDSAACILIVEIIVDLFQDKISLEVLGRLARAKSSTARAFVAHGLVYFIKKCGNGTWSAEVLSKLSQLSTDQAELVRDEATAAIARLRRT